MLNCVTGIYPVEIFNTIRISIMNKLVINLSVAFALLFCGSTYAALMDFDFSGTFSSDNDIVLLDFSLNNDGLVTIFSSSWGDDLGDGLGWVSEQGFDPILAIWDSNGDLVSEQDDGGVEGTTQSNGVDYTYGVWDSFFSVFLTAGDYTASIAQYNNFAVDNLLSHGFTHDGNPNFTFDEGFGTEPNFNGVWIGDDSRTGDWEFHILNVDVATQQVPEPTTIALMALSIAGLGFRRKK